VSKPFWLGRKAQNKGPRAGESEAVVSRADAHARLMPRLLLVVAMAVALAMLIVACGGASGGAGTDSSGAENLRVSLILAVTNLPFSQRVQDGAETAARGTGARLDVTGPTTVDPTAQSQMLQEAIQQRPAGVVLQPVPPDLFTRPLRDARSADVPAVLFEQLPADFSSVTAFVAPDHKETGKTVANAIVDELVNKHGENVRGEIVTAYCVDLPPFQLGLQGAREVFDERLPNVDVIGPLLTAPEPNNNFAAWEEIMRAHPDALAYMGRCEADGPSLAKLKRQEKGDYVITAWDRAPQSLEAIKNGEMLAVMADPFFLEGYVPTRLIAEAAKGGEPVPQGWYDPGGVLVTEENVDEFTESEATPESQRAYYEDEIDEFFQDPQGQLRPLSEFPQPQQ